MAPVMTTTTVMMITMMVMVMVMMAVSQSLSNDDPCCHGCQPSTHSNLNNRHQPRPAASLRQHWTAARYKLLYPPGVSPPAPPLWSQAAGEEVSPPLLHGRTPWCWSWPEGWDTRDIPLPAQDIRDIPLAAEVELPGLDKEEPAGGRYLR